MLKIYAYAILISAYFFFNFVAKHGKPIAMNFTDLSFAETDEKCNCYKVFKEYQLKIYCSQLWFHLEYLNCILLSLLEICRGLYALAITKSTNFQ